MCPLVSKALGGSVSPRGANSWRRAYLFVCIYINK